MKAGNSLEVIKTAKAGLPVGPYCQGIKAGGFIFVAGQTGMDPTTKKVVYGGIETETRQCLENVKAILEEAGSSMDRVIKTEVFMTNLQEFAKMNGIYAEYLSLPGRTTVEVKRLPSNAKVEITVTALA